MGVLENLNYRYACKRFDENKKIKEEDLAKIIEAINLSPTSYGLQAFRVLHIQNSEVRKELQAHSWNQPQIVEASDLLVFCANTKVTEELIAEYMNRTAETRGLEVEQLKEFSDLLKGSLLSLPEEIQQVWTGKQTYIPLGNAMTMAAELGIDGCPMEGFDPQKYVELLGLKEQNLYPTAVLALGYRSADEPNQHNVKVRKAIEDLVVTV